MVFEELDEFKKDLKTLLKKYRSLNEDLAVVRKILEVLPDERPPFSFQIDGLGLDTCVIKVRKIACKALKGRGVNSGLRLIYAYFEERTEVQEEIDQVEEVIPARIVFVELYHKNTKSLEDRERIFRHFD